MSQNFDFLIIGGGVAGLSFALEAAAHGKVAILTKRARAECNTAYAQGGIASVLAQGDSFEAHIEDTLTAGAGLPARSGGDHRALRTGAGARAGGAGGGVQQAPG